MQRLLNNMSNITYLHILGGLLIHHKYVITIAVRFNFFFFSVPLSQLRNMIQDVVRTLTFMYSSLDRWVLSEVFSFRSLIFHWCSLKKTNCRINFNVSREFLKCSFTLLLKQEFCCSCLLVSVLELVRDCLSSLCHFRKFCPWLG